MIKDTTSKAGSIVRAMAISRHRRVIKAGASAKYTAEISRGTGSVVNFTLVRPTCAGVIKVVTL